MEKDVKNGERCMYFVCDFNGRWLKDSSLFNGRWLKDSSLLCCMVILLNEEGRVIDNI